MNEYTGSRGELKFEADFVKMLTEVGWDENIINRPTHKDLEKNLRNILNENNVDKLEDIPLTDGEFSQIMEKINGCTTPVSANILLNGKEITIKSEIIRKKYNVGDEIYLFLFDPIQVAGGKSRYQIVEQPIYEAEGQYAGRRGDVLLLVNGLPVISIELKASGVSIDEATNQIQKYMNENAFRGLFNLIQVFFIATPEDIRYFANTKPVIKKEYIFHWGDIFNKQINDWKKLVKGENQILSIPEAHQLVSYYTTAYIGKDSEGRIENVNSGYLMVARSYQVYAIRNILRRVKNQTWGTHDPLGGYVWGTTGCGKTLTSFKAGQLIVDKNYADKVVYVVDRNELNEQSYSEYMAFSRDGEPIKKTENTHVLFKALMGSSDRLIITSIQKLSNLNEDKSGYVNKDNLNKINSKRIVFITDEAHRSQFGEMHEYIKNTFTNAVFIGFTGTPIFGENEKKGGLTTEAIFGKCLSTYSIVSAIRDKNVLGFDPKMVRTFDDNDLKRAIACKKANVSSEEEAKKDKEKAAIFYKYLKNTPMIEIEKELPSGQYDCDEHRKAVVADIVKNWSSLSYAGDEKKFHALLATTSIPEAIEYYHLFKNTELKVTTIFDASANSNTTGTLNKDTAVAEIVDDYNKMFGTGTIINRSADPTLKTFKADVIARLSHKVPYTNIKESEMIDLVIVVDQLLTGFDSKYVNTLYLDKFLETDNLIQAISRTNRVLDFAVKPWGVFRYYRRPYTMSVNIHEALKLYCEGGEDSGAIVSDIEDNVKKANELFVEIDKIFKNAKIDNFMSCPKNAVDALKFQKTFRELMQVVNGMKLQGMNWKSDNDEYVNRLDVCNKWLDGNTRLYDILMQRYEDLKPVKNTNTNTNNRLGFSLSASLSEVEKEKIDADYLEKNFKQVVPVLMGDYENEEKEKKIEDFKLQLGVLSEEQQKFANIIIEDIKTRKLTNVNKTLRELIAEYQANEETKKIKDFANEYGLDEEMLREIYKKDDVSDIAINNILENYDEEKVLTKFGKNKLIAKSKLRTEICEFIAGIEEE